MTHSDIQPRLLRWITVPVLAALPLLAALPSSMAHAAARAGTPSVTQVAAQAGRGSPSPSLVDFGPWWSGSQVVPVTVTLTNKGTGTLAIQDVLIQATTGGDFSVTGGTCQNRNLRPGSSCQVAVAFHPGAATRVGVITDELVFDAPNTPVVTVTGIVLLPGPALGQVTPPAVDFGSVRAGHSASTTVTLTNVGGAPLTIASNTFGEDPNDFTTNHGCQGVTLMPGDYCVATVRYAPVRGTDSGDQYGTLWFLDASYEIYGEVPVHGYAA